MLADFDCKMAKEMASGLSTEKEFTEKMNKALAEKLSLSITQQFEELTLLDRYFESVGSDLIFNSKQVASACQLETIARPDCPGQKEGEDFKKKLALLTEEFPSKTGGKNESLFEKLKNKSNETRGIHNNFDKKKCPVEGDGGAYFIVSQMTPTDAETLQNLSTGEMPAAMREMTYKKYPQLKMLLDLKNMGPAGKNLFDDFERKIKNYEKSQGPVAEVIKKFFKEKNTQSILAYSLVNKCTDLKEKITTFLCTNANYIGISEGSIKPLFSNKNIIFLEAKSYSCNVDTNEKKIRDDSFKDIYKIINKGTRPEFSSFSRSKNVDSFCEMYTCTNSQIKNLPSCSNGGPVTSADLEENCKKRASGCSGEIEKAISFLRGFENDIERSNPAEIFREKSLGGIENKKEKKKYSLFYQNFLGVEGTIQAEGITPTDEIIAQKKNEFREKKIGPEITHSFSLPMTNSDSLSLTPNLKTEETTQTTEVFSQINETNNNNKYKNNALTQVTPSSIKESTKSLGIKIEDENRYKNELKNLNKELADAINSLQGTDEEKIRTIARNNSQVISQVAKGSVEPKNVFYPDINESERKKLDAYRNSLNSWESKLRTWENKIRVQERGEAFANNLEGPSYQKDENVRNNTKEANGNSSSLLTTKNETNLAKNSPLKDESKNEEIKVVEAKALLNLEITELKKFGITELDSFVMHVRHLDKIYSVAVKRLVNEGKSMLVPLLDMDEKNKELALIIYNSALFKDYRESLSKN